MVNYRIWWGVIQNVGEEGFTMVETKNDSPPSEVKYLKQL